MLILLAASPAGAMRRDKLAALLWPEKDAGRARHRLADTLHGLRASLGKEAVCVSGGELRLDRDAVWSDVAEFGTAIAAGDRERAVSLYRGPFLDGFFVRGAGEFERWAEADRDRYAREAATALEELAASAEARGDHAAAVRWWRQFVSLEPFNTRGVLGLMGALATTGDRAGALAQARIHSALLRDELGLEPEPAVLALAERLTGRPTGTPRIRSVAVGGTGREAPAMRVGSLAVLPFANLGLAEDDEWVADGMTEELIHALRQTPGLRVTARTSSFALKGRNLDVREIGRMLGVEGVLEGSVRRDGRRLRIIVRLVETADASQLWSERYDRRDADILGLQEEIARAVVEALAVRSPGSAGTGLPRLRIVDPEAHERYLEGRYFLNTRTREGMLRAVDCFERVITHHPRHARGHAGLAETWLMLGSGNHGVLPPREAMERAQLSAERALACQDDLAEAHVSLGIAFMHAWEWDRAREGLQRAIELDPDSAAARHRLGWLLAVTGDFEVGLSEVLRAQELDPLSLPISNAVGRIQEFLGRLEEATGQYRRSLALDPTCADAYSGLGTAYIKKGLHQEAVAALRRARDLACTPGLVALHAFGLALADEHDAARTVVRDLLERVGRENAPAAHVGDVHMALGAVDEGFEWYERAYEQRSPTLMYLKADPMWAPMREDPRWADLVQRIGL